MMILWDIKWITVHREKNKNHSFIRKRCLSRCAMTIQHLYVVGTLEKDGCQRRHPSSRIQTTGLQSYYSQAFNWLIPKCQQQHSSTRIAQCCSFLFQKNIQRMKRKAGINYITSCIWENKHPCCWVIDY